MALQQVFYDSFTESSDTNLVSHTPDTGTGWVALSNSANNTAVVEATGDYLRQPFYSGSFSAYKISVGASQHDDQAAEIIVNGVGNRTIVAVQLQDDTTNFTCYYARFDTGANSIDLFRRDDGSDTEIGSASHTYSSGDKLKIEYIGDELNVYVNDTLMVGPITDSNLAGGVPGIMTSNAANDPSGDDFYAWMGPAGTTVSATSAGINVSTFQATVTTGSATNVNATSASISVSANDATVSANTAVSATSASVNLTTYQATVSLGSGANVTATSSSIDIATFAATVSAPATITTDPLSNNTGTLLTSTSGIIAAVYSLTDGSLVVRKTGLTSDGSGIVSFTDASLAGGTTYHVLITVSATSADGVARIQAA